MPVNQYDVYLSPEQARRHMFSHEAIDDQRLPEINFTVAKSLVFWLNKDSPQRPATLRRMLAEGNLGERKYAFGELALLGLAADVVPEWHINPEPDHWQNMEPEPMPNDPFMPPPAGWRDGVNFIPAAIKKAQPREEEDVMRYPEFKEKANLINSYSEFSPFKMDYANREELADRVLGCIILVNNSPVYVRDVAKGNDFIVSVPGEERLHRVKWDNISSLRSPRPGYTPYDGTVRYMVRPPHRQNHQGMNENNTKLYILTDKKEGKREWFRPDMITLLEGMGKRRVRMFKPALIEALEEGDVSELYITPDIAVYEQRGKINLAYCGKTVGKLFRARGAQFILDKPYNTNPILLEDLDRVNITRG